jgi:hypothetical protein
MLTVTHPVRFLYLHNDNQKSHGRLIVRELIRLQPLLYLEVYPQASATAVAIGIVTIGDVATSRVNHPLACSTMRVG